MFSRTLSIVLALAFTAACQLNGPVIAHTASPTGPTRDPVLAAEVILEVVTKRDPDTLMARDGSACRVSPDVYATTQVGSMFRCRWLRN